MISVIVPYWNSEHWLQRCLASLISQKGNFEFLFVDDNSTDEGKKIVTQYAAKDKRIVVLKNEHSKGVSGARNTGIEYAMGEWITFLDADDEYLPDAYDTFRSALKVTANWYQYNHMRYFAKSNKLVVRMENYGGWYTRSDPPNWWFGVWNKLYRADFINDICFNEDLQYGEDGLFNLECFAKDNRIYHAEKQKMIVKHILENKKSLSHIKTCKDLLHHAHTYEEFMLRQPDPTMRIMVCKELSRLWDSPSFEKCFGEMEYDG